MADITGVEPGRKSKVQISDFDPISFINLGRVVDATLNLNVDELDITSHDSGATREFIPNFSDATLDISMRYDETDAGQVKLISKVLPTPVLFKIQFDPVSGAGHVRYEADAFATSHPIATPLDDAGTVDISLRLSSINKTTQ